MPGRKVQVPGPPPVTVIDLYTPGEKVTVSLFDIDAPTSCGWLAVVHVPLFSRCQKVLTAPLPVVGVGRFTRLSGSIRARACRGLPVVPGRFWKLAGTSTPPTTSMGLGWERGRLP